MQARAKKGVMVEHDAREGYLSHDEEPRSMWS
jgi:hypothetical protein